MIPKKRVKFLESIAGLADPDTKALDRKYEEVTSRAKAKAAEQNRELKAITITSQINAYKAADRYNDVKRGFQKDFSFRPGQEASIPESVALVWEEAGICNILDEPKSKAA